MRWKGGRHRHVNGRHPAAWPTAERAVRAEPAMDRQELVLHGAQLVHWDVEGEELVLDLWGGTGTWMGFCGDDLVATGQVSNPPAFTVRAHLDGTIDLELLGRLEHLSGEAQLLTVQLDAAGSAVLERPLRIELSDGIESLTVGMSSLT